MCSDELLLIRTPSTPEEQQHIDDDRCPATREEFRKMRRQLKETRQSVNELIQKQWEDDQFLDMRTLLRVAQRANQTTRDQLEEAKMELTGRLRARDDRVHTMEVGFAELNDWAAR